MKSFNYFSAESYTKRASYGRPTRYISAFANPVGRYGKQQVMHIAGTANYTLCGRVLSDPYTVAGDHKLCSQCERKRANS